MEILNDFNVSVEKSLSEIDKNWRKYEGLIVCGTHTPSNTDEIIDRIRETRERMFPFLGICAGMQLAAIEIARNMLEIKNATSEEFGEGTYIVKKNPMGLRVGLYKVGENMESFWHNYYVDSKYFISSPLYITDLDKEISLKMRLRNYPYYKGVQFHPEYQSSKDKPHPILKEFLEICRKPPSV